MYARVFLSAMALFLTTGQSMSSSLDCNISQKQIKSLRSLLCGSSSNRTENCFAHFFEQRYDGFAREISNLKVCGYADLAKSREAALMQLADILKPLSQCIGQRANLHNIFAEKKIDAEKSAPRSCEPDTRVAVMARIPELRKFVRDMNNPETVKIRLYGILGVKALNN